MNIREYKTLGNRARALLTHALADGIVRQPCIKCNNPKSQGHHTDYREPLLVTWLCSKHHGEQHRGKPRTYQWLGDDSGVPAPETPIIVWKSQPVWTMGVSDVTTL